jgi:antibiotic biosynthesis monooxygenase (ABM) superfamily enzyme
MARTLTIFRNRLVDDPEATAEYERWADEMSALVVEQPGFLAKKTFVASDGERVTLAEFDSAESALGRARFYQSFRVLTVDASGERRFDRD